MPCWGLHCVDTFSPSLLCTIIWADFNAKNLVNLSKSFLSCALNLTVAIVPHIRKLKFYVHKKIQTQIIILINFTSLFKHLNILIGMRHISDIALTLRLEKRNVKLCIWIYISLSLTLHLDNLLFLNALWQLFNLLMYCNTLEFLELTQPNDRCINLHDKKQLSMVVTCQSKECGRGVRRDSVWPVNDTVCVMAILLPLSCGKFDSLYIQAASMYGAVI